MAVVVLEATQGVIIPYCNETISHILQVNDTNLYMPTSVNKNHLLLQPGKESWGSDYCYPIEKETVIAPYCEKSAMTVPFQGNNTIKCNDSSLFKGEHNTVQ